MKKTFIIFMSMSLACFMFFTITCNHENKEWEQTKQQNTVEAYTNFIEDYPDSKHIADAQQLLDELIYTWEDGFLSKEYIEESKIVGQAFSNIINEQNSMIVGMESIQNGSIVTYIGSPTGSITFTDEGAKESIKIQVMIKDNNGSATLGFKVYDGERNTSLQLHQELIKNIQIVLNDQTIDKTSGNK